MVRRLGKIATGWLYRSQSWLPGPTAKNGPGRDFMGPGNHDPVSATRWQETAKIA